MRVSPLSARFVLFLSLVVGAALGASACAKDDVGAVAPANTAAHGLRAELPVPVGYALADCIERSAGFLYAVKRQEFGLPWKQQDTYAFFDQSKERIQVAFLGGSNSVDAAKERLSARRPAIEEAIELCEKRLDIEPGLTLKNLFLTYTRIDRKAGTLQDVIQYDEGRFDFPPDQGPQAPREWGPIAPFMAGGEKKAAPGASE